MSLESFNDKFYEEKAFNFSDLMVNNDNKGAQNSTDADANKFILWHII